METLLRIGAEVSKDSAKNLADLIDKIFSSAAKSRMDQKTVREALALVGRSLEVKDTRIENCVFNGDKIIQN